MDRVVLDASIYVKIFKNETDSKQAIDLVDDLIRSHAQMIEPSIAISETITICEASKQNIDKACDFFSALIDNVIHVVEVDDSLVRQSCEITKIGHDKSGYPTFNDCLYHAIAIRENALFITADKRHYEKTKHLGNIKLLRCSSPNLI